MDNKQKEKKKGGGGFFWVFFFVLFCFVFVFVLLFGLYWWHMEVPKLGVKSELQLLACATATGTPDLSYIYDLHHSSWQMLDP